MRPVFDREQRLLWQIRTATIIVAFMHEMTSIAKLIMHEKTTITVFVDILINLEYNYYA